MEEELLRQKYRNLQSKLYNIKEKLEELDDSYDDLKVLIKDSLLIDDNMVKESLMNSVDKSRKDIYSEIVSGLIPRINNKI